jgi:hypothetical protein
VAALSKKEQAIMDRLKASGYASNHAQLHAPFRFLVRPFTTVGIEVGKLASWFEDDVFSKINAFEFQSPITGIAIFPAIFDSAIAPPPKDYLKYKRSEKSVFVGVNINFAAWATGSQSERLNLLGENIGRSVEGIPEKYLSSLDRDRLLSVVSQTHDRLSFFWRSPFFRCRFMRSDKSLSVAFSTFGTGSQLASDY